MTVESNKRSGPIDERRDSFGIGEPMAFRRNQEGIALDFLDAVIAGQIKRQVAGDFKQFKSDNPIEVFKGEEVFKRLILKSRAFLDKQDISKEDHLRNSLRGRLFEEIAYRILSSRYGGDRAVISPSDTLEFFRQLIPESNIKESYFQRSLDGFYVPDGLLVDPKDGRITDVLEYAVSVRPKTENTHLVNLGRILGNYADSLDEARIKLVYPVQDIPEDIVKRLSLLRPKDIPVSIEEVYELEEEAFDEILEVASPEYFIKRYEKQRERFLELERAGELDDNWREFGRNHAGEIDLLRNAA